MAVLPIWLVVLALALAFLLLAAVAAAAILWAESRPRGR
jgi:hypothetical protein